MNFENFDMSSEALQARARSAVQEVAVRATERATARMQAQERMDSAPPLSDQTPARALSLEAASQEIRTMAKHTTDPVDPLSFLNAPPPPPRLASQLLDDAALTPPVVLVPVGFPSPGAPDDDVARRARTERDAAEADLDAKLRKLELGELYDLKKCDRIPPILLPAERFLALVNLMIRVMTFGLVKRQNALADARLARQKLVARAGEELQRRKRTPAGAKAKLQALTIETQALDGRRRALEARMSRPGGGLQTHEIRATARDLWEGKHDIAATMAGTPSIGDGRDAIAALDAEVQQRAEQQHEAEADARVPAGFGGVLMSVTAKVRAARKRVVELTEQQTRDERRRARFAALLEELIAAFRLKFRVQLEDEEAEIRAERMATVEEIEQLGLELRERIPAERLGLARRSAEADRPPTKVDAYAAHADAEQAERDRVRRELSRGG